MKFIIDWIENGMLFVSDLCINCYGMRLIDFLFVCILYKFCKKDYNDLLVLSGNFIILTYN